MFHGLSHMDQGHHPTFSCQITPISCYPAAGLLFLLTSYLSDVCCKSSIFSVVFLMYFLSPIMLVLTALHLPLPITRVYICEFGNQEGLIKKEEGKKNYAYACILGTRYVASFTCNWERLESQKIIKNCRSSSNGLCRDVIGKYILFISSIKLGWFCGNWRHC